MDRGVDTSLSSVCVGKGDRTFEKTWEGSGVLKWFDPVKGFGFIVVDGNEPIDAFLHAKVIAGQGSLISPGDRARCRFVASENGVRVAEILEVENLVERPERFEAVAKVKFFNPKKGFGFLRVDNCEDIFLGGRLLERLGLQAPLVDQRLLVGVVRRDRGLVAETVRPV